PGSATPAGSAPGAILYSAGGGEPRTLDVGPGENCEPDWSPDATRIVFVSSRDGQFRLYVADADGANPKILTTPPPGSTTSCRPGRLTGPGLHSNADPRPE